MLAATSSALMPDAPAIRPMAIALPAAAFLVGLTADRIAISRAIVRALAVGGTLAVVTTVAAGVTGRAPSRRHVAQPRPHVPPIRRLSVVIPARDEADVLGALLTDLAAAGSRVPADIVLAITVIDDRSRDATAAVIAGSASPVPVRLVRTAGPGGGKAAALAAVDDLGSGADHLVVVLDADARVDPSFLAALAASVEGADVAVAARRRMLRPCGGLAARILATLQDDEQTIDDRIQRGRAAMGGAADLRGDGMALRASALAAIGGWPVTALTEDLEVSTLLFLRAGTPVVRAPGVVVHEQPVLDVRSLARQRVRWAEGAVRRDLRLIWPSLVARDVPARRRLDLVAGAILDLVPIVALGAALSRATSRTPSGARSALVTVGTGWVASTAIAAVGALVADDPPHGARSLGTLVARVGAAIAFSALWSIALTIGWVRVACAPARGVFRPTRHRPAERFARR